jgi:hypothetical protein
MNLRSVLYALVVMSGLVIPSAITAQTPTDTKNVSKTEVTVKSEQTATTSQPVSNTAAPAPAPTSVAPAATPQTGTDTKAPVRVPITPAAFPPQELNLPYLVEHIKSTEAQRQATESKMELEYKAALQSKLSPYITERDRAYEVLMSWVDEMKKLNQWGDDVVFDFQSVQFTAVSGSPSAKKSQELEKKRAQQAATPSAPPKAKTAPAK